MKHLAAIQTEFLKQSNSGRFMSWDRLSLEQQRRYLKEHPKSKRRLTGQSITDKLKRREEAALATPWIDKWLDADDYHSVVGASSNLASGIEYTVNEPFTIYQMTKSEANPNDMIGTAMRHKYWIQQLDVKPGDRITADTNSNEVFLNNDRDHPIFINKPHISSFQKYPVEKIQRTVQ